MVEDFEDEGRVDIPGDRARAGIRRKPKDQEALTCAEGLDNPKLSDCRMCWRYRFDMDCTLYSHIFAKERGGKP